MPKTKLVWNWVPPIGWALVVFWGSATPSLRATPLALRLLERLAVLPGLRCVSPFLCSLLSSPLAETVLRKAGHIAEFAVLAYLVSRAIAISRQGDPLGTQTHRPYTRPAGLLSLLYAFADEAHQRFVPGRSARLEDVVIDAVGIALGLFVARKVFR